MPNHVLNSQLSSFLICTLDASAIATCSETKKKSGGGGCIGTKLGAEQQNTVSVVYECRLGTNTGFSVKLSDCSQPTAWALNTAFVLSHHQRHWEAKSSNTWPLAASPPLHAVQRAAPLSCEFILEHKCEDTLSLCSKHTLSVFLFEVSAIQRTPLSLY